MEPEKLVLEHNHWMREKMRGQDWVIVNEVYLEDCYGVGRLPFKPEYVVDVGACIGSFSKKVHESHPGARIIAVECCPENIPVLLKNVAGFAQVEPSAVYYGSEKLALLNSVYEGCLTTGGSTVVRLEDAETYKDSGPERLPGQELKWSDRNEHYGQKREYWADLRPLDSLTLENLCKKIEYDFPRIDVLKLDCEGSELNILENITMADRIKWIVGEWHCNEKKIRNVISKKFKDWDFKVLREGGFGMFRLVNKTIVKGLYGP